MKPVNPYRFEPMNADDLPWVCAREAELHEHPWTSGNFADALEAGYSCWMMYDADEAVGYGIVLQVFDESHLLNISIARAVQGQGRGGCFLDFLFSRARESGTLNFFLEVRPSNTSAVNLYARKGFVEIGRRKGYYPAANGREDAIVMRLAL